MITFIDKTRDGVMFHRRIDDSRRVDSLPAGIYSLDIVDLGNEYVPGFEPLEADNDPPLEVDEKALTLTKEMAIFFTKQDVFKSLGFSHKRGYLLYGPPGCGKTSTLRLLQKHFVKAFDGVVLIWNKKSFTEHLDQMRNFEPKRPVMVVCEDIDSMIESFEKHMLEVLDGQRGLNNFILVATTNNLAAIPSRIKDRPSRIDRLVEIGLPDRQTRLNYLLSIKLPADQADELATASGGLSIAKLKEIVVATVCLGEPLQTVLKRVGAADMTVSNDDKDDESDGDFE